MSEKKGFPRIVCNFSDEEMENAKKKEDAKYIIKTVESLNGSDKGNLFVLKQMNNELQDLTNGTVCVRIWCLDNLVFCNVVYASDAVKELFDIIY